MAPFGTNSTAALRGTSCTNDINHLALPALTQPSRAGKFGNLIAGDARRRPTLRPGSEGVADAALSRLHGSVAWHSQAGTAVQFCVAAIRQIFRDPYLGADALINLVHSHLVSQSFLLSL
jgi:hypothetical protein